MKISILLFGPVRVILGTEQLVLDLPKQSTVRDAVHKLLQLYPKLRTMEPCLRYAIDTEYVDHTAPLQEGQTLALIPPVQGG